MQCISRYTDDTYSQYFGDNKHKFYLEFRCNRPCFKNREVCIKCIHKTIGCARQQARTFDHGNVNDPIPDNSHIYGGKWYLAAEKKWGRPPSEIIEFALMSQEEARHNVPSKVIDTSIPQEMPKVEGVKRKPRAGKVVEDSTDSTPAKPVTKRKPKAGTLPSTEVVAQVAEVVTQVVAVAVPLEPKKKGGRPKKAEPTPYSSLVNVSPRICKEVTLPTHIEKTLEEFATDGYAIEYVKLSSFDVGQTTYFRDSIKNKLYKKHKENRIGDYVGRYDSHTDSIRTDIPDSDDES